MKVLQRLLLKNIHFVNQVLKSATPLKVCTRNNRLYCDFIHSYKLSQTSVHSSRYCNFNSE